MDDANKQYLIYGTKDGVDYYYRAIDAHKSIAGLEENVTELLKFKTAAENKHAELDTKIETKVGEIADLAIEKTINEKVAGVADEVNRTIQKHNEDFVKLADEIKIENKKEKVFEVTKAPKGTVVNYDCNEIRILCPADTNWETYSIERLMDFSDSADFRYVEFCVYAPDAATSYKEIVSHDYPEKEYESESKVPFNNTDDIEYAGVNTAGMKFSVYYFPVAMKNTNGGWDYLGARSTINDYNGWYYTIDWYDKEELLLKSNTVRVNLASDVSNFRYIDPSYEHSIWKKYEDLEEKYNALLERIEALEAKHKEDEEPSEEE